MLNRHRPLALVAALLAILAWMLFGWEPGTEKPSAHGISALEQPPQGGDFTLRSSAGAVSLADFRGKVVLVYFGYTWCPDICPLNLGHLRLALGRLTPEERQRVQVLFISVDPQRDTPERLDRYTDYFAPEILGLTGTPEQLAATAALFGAAYQRGEEGASALGYAVDHSAHTYLLDPSGRLRQVLEHAMDPDRIVVAIRNQLTTGET